MDIKEDIKYERMQFNKLNDKYMNVYYNVKEDIEYRQDELNDMIAKYLNGYYNDYYMNEMLTLMVFVRYEPGLTIRNCKNIEGLVNTLPIRSL